MENSVSGLVQTKRYYGPVWIKTRTVRQFSVEVPHIEFQQNLLRSLWNKDGSVFMALGKLGLIMDKNG
jgi:hypothetical protein